MILGVDTNQRLSGAAVSAAGYRFAIRYLSTPGNQKNITRPELVDLTGHGVRVFLVFETTAGRAGQGRAAGEADARSAVAQQSALGIPSTYPVLYAVDYDADPATVEPYFAGVHAVHGADGGYGSCRVVTRLLDAGLICTAWQAAAWSYGAKEPRRDLFQRIGTVVVGGVACDVNECYDDQFAYPAPKGDPAAPTPSGGGNSPTEDEDMYLIHESDAEKNARYCVLFAQSGKFQHLATMEAVNTLRPLVLNKEPLPWPGHEIDTWLKSASA